MTREQSKKLIHELHQKHYATKEPDAVAKHAAGLKKEPKVTRYSLMEQAKSKGIKYFRILNKAELGEILTATIAPERIQEITTGAIKRWKLSNDNFTKEQAQVDMAGKL